ncbi:MAG: hypothetical protein IK136_03025 [Oscillospiraceae bacterium]|nr:hypothetical protein [Oscillospiraceae bacterium]
MAKKEYRINADFDEVVRRIHAAMMQKNVSASCEDSCEFACGDTRCAVRVYERYSMFGSNQVSLNVTVFGRDGDVCVSLIASGGSQAMFLKSNPRGEEAFLSVADGILSFWI